MLIVLALCSLAAYAQVREMETAQTREQEVRAVIEKFNLAYEQKDLQSMSDLVRPDLTAFAGGQTYASWSDYSGNFLRAAFSRHLPGSTWEIKKVVTAPEMAWAYTKTTYAVRRQGQQIQAELYQLFVVQKESSASHAAKSKPVEAANPAWKIAVIDYTLHREPQAAQPQPENSQSGSQPK